MNILFGIVMIFVSMVMMVGLGLLIESFPWIILILFAIVFVIDRAFTTPPVSKNIEKLLETKHF